MAGGLFSTLRAEGEPEKPETFKYTKWDEATKGAARFEGYFNILRKDGTVYIELRADQLNKDFLIMSSIGKGIGVGWILTGMILEDWLVEFQRVDSKIYLVRKNVKYKAKKGTPMGDAVEMAFSDSIIAALPISSCNPQAANESLTNGQGPEDAAATFLVDISSIFVSDLMGLAEGLEIGDARFTFDRSRSVMSSIKAFPKNVELRAALSFRASTYSGLDSLPDGRSLPITLHYSLASLPSSGYQPRHADDRVGYFVTATKNFTSDDEDSKFVRLINRWRLEKADSKSKFSAPEQPIIFYLEKTIPYRFRHYVREGILEWNKAFAKLGFADAIEVRIQSDGDDWDPEDARYNTIRWAPDADFGIGPSRVDPRTGEILDADILLGSGFVDWWIETYRTYVGTLGGDPTTGADESTSNGNGQSHTRKRFERIARELNKDLLQFQHQPSGSAQAGSRHEFCSLPKGLRDEFNVGIAHLGTTTRVTPSDPVPEEFIGAALKDLTMHEVGHTLGLRHNFKASSIRTLEEMQNADLTAKEGLVGSVMDYNPINLAADPSKQGEFYPSTIGPYDQWAIEYGYTVYEGQTPISEIPKLQEISVKATEKELAYGTDEEAYPLRERNLDPGIQQFDLSEEPLDFAKARIQIIRDAMKTLPDSILLEGKAYNRVRAIFSSLLYSYFRVGRIVATYIGGQYQNRFHRGDKVGETAASLPFEPVPLEKQMAALDFLTGTLFTDPDLPLTPDLLNSLAPSYWGHWGTNLGGQARLDFPIHEAIWIYQYMTLVRLFAPEVLTRIVDTELKYAANKAAMTLPILFTKITDGVWSDLSRDPKSSDWSPKQPFISSFRRQLQGAYLDLLGDILLDRFTYAMHAAPEDAKALAFEELERIISGVDKLQESKVKLDAYSKSHLAWSRSRARKILDAVHQLY